MKKSTSELDELKVLLKKYLKTESNNKSPRSDKNVKFALTSQNDANTTNTNTNSRKKGKTPSFSSSNSDISLTSLNVGSRKKIPKEPRTHQVMDIEKKSKVIKIKQISKSTKTKKCDLSDISESNEMERNSSSSDILKSKPSPIKKQNKMYSKREPSTCKDICNDICKDTPSDSIIDKQAEFILNIISKSSSSLLSSDEEKRTHIRDFIDKQPKDSNDLTNPPNTVRLAQPEKNENSKSTEIIKTDMIKKKSLEVQILPLLDIRRSLITQKLPDVAIECIDNNVVDTENVKYIQITHGSNLALPQAETPEIVKPANEVKSEPDKIVPTESSKKDKICPNDCGQEASSPKTKVTDNKITEIYIAHQRILSSSDDIEANEVPPPATNKKLKNVSEERRTVSEELNLDIDNLPSVRTLKEIQNYLEQKCSLIRSRLQEESTLKTGETLSLRYKLSQPPLWQSSTVMADAETEANIVTEAEPEVVPKQITLSPLKTYSSIKSPLSPLQKHDKSQQINNNPSLISAPKSKLQIKYVKTIDKSLQVSISENMELPVARKDDTCCSPQLSIETSNKDFNEIRENFSTPSIPSTLSNTVKRDENSDSIPQMTVSNQKDNFKVICLPCSKDVAINTDLLVPLEYQETSKTLAEVSTQVSENCPRKHVSFEIVTTNQFSLFPKENKETQISQLDLEEIRTKPPIEKVEKKQCRNEKTQTTKFIQSNTTQTVDVKDKFTICNMQKPVNETRECCTQYSPPVLQQQVLDTTEYKTISSFRNVDKSENDEQNKHIQVHYPPEERRHHCKRNTRNKLSLPRHKVCSTPESPSSISSTTEAVSISDGEVKLSCECSTSIGEIHLCRFANNIRKKVRILKQNPEEVLKESLHGPNFQIKRQHKYDDNWFAYYVTKTESSSEHATGSNISSIKSNIDTE